MPGNSARCSSFQATSRAPVRSTGMPTRPAYSDRSSNPRATSRASSVPGLASKPVWSSAVFALLVPAPTSGPASSSVTRRSKWLSSRAIAQPTTPAATIATSVSSGSCTGPQYGRRCTTARANALRLRVGGVGACSSIACRQMRDLDVVLFGATGFVGKLTADYLARAAPDGARIGLAGRSPDKLERVRGELGARAADWPLIVADSHDGAALADLAARTTVVATTVGPYRRYGVPLVEACAAEGTHYADLTGETLFM